MNVKRKDRRKRQYLESAEPTSSDNKHISFFSPVPVGSSKVKISHVTVASHLHYQLIKAHLSAV